MKKIKLTNFRKIQEDWNIELAPITFFTGTNNSGKSTVFKSMLLLEDYVKSNNHFQLDFNGFNQRKHKIDSFSNSVNRINRANLELDIKLEYTNKNHDITLVFKPMDIDDGVISKGKLKLFEISTLDTSSKLIIENTASDDYILKLDLDFLSKDQNIEDSNKIELEELDLILTNKKILEEDEVKLKEAKLLRKESLNKLNVLELYSIKENNESHSIKRLNKVLRELNISLDRATEFLNSKGVEIEPRPTTKIGNDIYKLLSDEFTLDKSKKSLSKKNSGEIERNNLKLIEKYIIDLNKKISDSKKRISDLNKKLKSTKKLKKDKIVLMPEFSLSDFQDDYLTIDSVIRKILPKYLVDEQTKFGKTDESIELQKAFSFGEKIRHILRFSVDHLSPHRNTQTRLYINNNMSSDINELIREHANNPISKASKAGKFLKKWMNEFDIGQDFKIKQIEGVATQIEITHEGLKVNLADKGFGAGQVFTILFKIALSIDLIQNKLRASQKGLRKENGSYSFIILIEEPEANLHPALQTKLTELFYSAYKEFNIRFVIETHSEYSLRKSQSVVKALIKNGTKIEGIPFAVYYFDKDSGPYRMNYRKDGKFIEEFGSGFFDVSSNLAFDIL